MTHRRFWSQLPDSRCTRCGDMILGVEEFRLGPRYSTRVGAAPYLFGDAKTGKTAFLRSTIQETTRLYSPSEAKIVTPDMRRSLPGDTSLRITPLRYLTNHQEAMGQLRDLAKFLRNAPARSDVTLGGSSRADVVVGPAGSWLTTTIQAANAGKPG